MEKVPVKDMIIVVPGIMGSILEKKGQPVWAPSLGAVWRLLRHADFKFKALELKDDDPERDELDDGIQATRIIKGAQLLPGFWKDLGYAPLSRQLKANFLLEEGSTDSDEAANYFEFAYDWRRDNKGSANRLKKLVDKYLPKWREAGHPRARIILIAHSMGGLVARHYLEALGGAEHCRAFYTFGTPFKGSANALNFLANGYDKLYIPLMKEVLRTFTSVYQLLPLYKAVEVEGQYRYVGDLPSISGLNAPRLRDGREFLKGLFDAAERNGGDRPYLFHPTVGTKQRTFQSLSLVGGRLKPSRKLPHGVPEEQDHGDGTVPRVSAVPDDGSVAGYIGERHGALQNNGRTLYNMVQQIIAMQDPEALSNVRELQVEAPRADERAISLEVEDLYYQEEPVRIQAAVTDGGGGQLKAYVERMDEPGEKYVRQFESGEVASFGNLPGGVYQVRVHSVAPSNEALQVHDVFEVASAAGPA